MNRTVEAEVAILSGCRAWSATPGDYSSLRSVALREDGTGLILYGYGQTIYAKIDCKFEVPAAGRIRLEYLPTPQLQRRPPFQPDAANRFKEIGFILAEGENVFRESITGSVSRFTWTLEFAEHPYPDGLSFPYSVPNIFYGYREKVDNGQTPSA